MPLPYDREHYEQELIQVAAVAVAAIRASRGGRADLEGMTLIFADISHERVRQNAKFGEQDHNPFIWMTILGEEFGEACQAALKWELGL